MMRFAVIKGEEFRTDLTGTLQLRVMRDVKRQFGFGWAHVMEYLRHVDDDAQIGDLLSDEEFVAWMWAWARNAGSDITVDELLQCTADEIRFRMVEDRGEGAAATSSAGGVGAADPTEDRTSPRKASGRGAGAARKRAAKKSPKKYGTR